MTPRERVALAGIAVWACLVGWWIVQTGSVWGLAFTAEGIVMVTACHTVPRVDEEVPYV